MSLPANVVIDPHPEGEALSQRIRQYANRHQQLPLRISSSPLSEAEVGAYVIHESRLGELMGRPGRPDTWVPVLCHGSPRNLRNAFLTGCSDYMKDPWSIQELHCRVQRLLEGSAADLEWESLSLRPGCLAMDSRSVCLTVHEYLILSQLLRRRGDVVPREALCYALWGQPARGSRSLDVHISSIRKKIRALSPSGGDHSIRSVRGRGYFIP